MSFIFLKFEDAFLTDFCFQWLNSFNSFELRLSMFYTDKIFLAIESPMILTKIQQNQIKTIWYSQFGFDRIRLPKQYYLKLTVVRMSTETWLQSIMRLTINGGMIPAHINLNETILISISIFTAFCIRNNAVQYYFAQYKVDTSCMTSVIIFWNTWLVEKWSYQYGRWSFWPYPLRQR